MAGPTSTARRDVLQQIAAAIQSLEYGQVQITIHDSRVVEIATTAKKRFPPTS